MEGPLSEVGTPPPHNSEIPHVLVDGYANMTIVKAVI